MAVEDHGASGGGAARYASLSRWFALSRPFAAAVVVLLAVLHGLRLQAGEPVTLAGWVGDAAPPFCNGHGWIHMHQATTRRRCCWDPPRRRGPRRWGAGQARAGSPPAASPATTLHRTSLGLVAGVEAPPILLRPALQERRGPGHVHPRPHHRLCRRLTHAAALLWLVPLPCARGKI